MVDKTPAYKYAAYEKFLADNPDLSSEDSAFTRWYPQYALDELEKTFTEGDKFSLMEAIFVCGCSDLPLPLWVFNAYHKAFSALVFAKSKSWDDVLGLPHPKGTHLNAIKKEIKLKHKLYLAIEECIAVGTTIDEALFEEVGKKYGVGKTIASQYYYSEKNRIKNFHEILENNGIT